MIDENEIVQLKNRLAEHHHDYKSKLVKITALSRPTVIKFFQLKKIRAENAALIFDAGLDLLEELANQEQSREQKARLLIHNKKSPQQRSLKF